MYGIGNTVENCVREGTVSEVYPSRHSARVTFEDREGLVSAELPILTTFASKNKSYALPDVGERVVVLSVSNDPTSGSGYIIGSLYFTDRPALNDQDVTQVRFADSATVTYNRRDSRFEVKFADGSTITHDGKKGDLTMNINGNITITGERRLKIDIKDRIDITGGGDIWITASGDIIEQGSNIRLN